MGKWSVRDLSRTQCDMCIFLKLPWSTSTKYTRRFCFGLVCWGCIGLLGFIFVMRVFDGFVQKCINIIANALTAWHGDYCTLSPWWRHQLETFSALLALCVRNSPVTGEFPSQRPVRRSFDVFFDLRLNKRLIKQSRLRLFETPSRSLWRHCIDTRTAHTQKPIPQSNRGMCAVPVLSMLVHYKNYRSR